MVFKITTGMVSFASTRAEGEHSVGEYYRGVSQYLGTKALLSKYTGHTR